MKLFFIFHAKKNEEGIQKTDHSLPPLDNDLQIYDFYLKSASVGLNQEKRPIYRRVNSFHPIAF